MKKVEAVIRPFTVDNVKDALIALGVGGITVTEVRGSGHESDRIGNHPDAEDTADLVPKAAVEVIVPDDDVASVVSVICEAARTGRPGDGKVFVLPVSAAIRIRTGEGGRPMLVEPRTRSLIRGPTGWRRRCSSMGSRPESRRSRWRGYTRLLVILWLGWVVAVAGWFVSHVWSQRRFWLELARIHGPLAPPGDLMTWHRLATEATVSHMLSELLSTKEGWLLLAVVLVGIPGMVYGVLLGVGALTLWVVRGFRGDQ